MNCRFIDTGFNDAFTNMAIDEALLHYSEIPTLRLYRWKPKAVSVGYNQDIKEVNINYCRKNKIDIVKRITGGKAVFHDNEITYRLIIPENANLLPQGITQSYQIIADALVIAFKKISINAEIKKQKEKITTPICFNSSNWYELLTNNKKISGSAQRRINGKVLQHGSILIDFDCKKNKLLFDSKNPFDSIDNLKKRITSIKNELNKKISINELKSAVKFGFEKKFDSEFFEDKLSGEEIVLAKSLADKNFADSQNAIVFKKYINHLPTQFLLVG